MSAAQKNLELLLETSERTLPGRLLLRLLRFTRGLFVRLGDPLVGYELYTGQTLTIPFSHELPLLRKSCPGFLENLGRLARAIQDKLPGLCFVDVGANVGDSATVVRHHADCPILCIEGSRRYYEILVGNLSRLTGSKVESERQMIGWDDGVVNVRLVEQGGTARPVEGGDPTSVSSLSTVISRHPSFAQFKLIKVDTDGWDLRILRSEMALLARLKPVLFVEYDPDLEGTFEERLGFLCSLRDIGYRDLLAYLNTGELLLSTTLDQLQTMEDLDLFFSKSSAYLDLALFHGDDRDLFHHVRGCEREHFRRLKAGN